MASKIVDLPHPLGPAMTTLAGRSGNVAESSARKLLTSKCARCIDTSTGDAMTVVRWHYDKSLLEHVGITVVHGSPVPRVPGVASVPWITWIPDVAHVAYVLVHDHVLMELPHISPGQFMNVRAVDLTNRLAIHGVNEVASDVADGTTFRIVDVVSHVALPGQRTRFLSGLSVRVFRGLQKTSWRAARTYPRALEPARLIHERHDEPTTCCVLSRVLPWSALFCRLPTVKFPQLWG